MGPHMDYREELTTLADQFHQHGGQSPARVATIVLNQSTFFSRMANGGKCSVDAWLEVKGWFSDNWPEALPWPEGVERPGKKAA